MNTTKNKREFFTVGAVKRYLEQFDRDDEVIFMAVSSDKRIKYADVQVFGITDSETPLFVVDVNPYETESFDEKEDSE